MTRGRWAGIWAVALAGVLALSACGGQSEAAALRVEVTTVIDNDACPDGQTCAQAPLVGAQVFATRGTERVASPLDGKDTATLLLGEGTWEVSATAGSFCESVEVSVSGPVTIHCRPGPS